MKTGRGHSISEALRDRAVGLMRCGMNRIQIGEQLGLSTMTLTRIAVEAGIARRKPRQNQNRTPPLHGLVLDVLRDPGTVHEIKARGELPQSIQAILGALSHLQRMGKVQPKERINHGDKGGHLTVWQRADADVRPELERCWTGVNITLPGENRA